MRVFVRLVLHLCGVAAIPRHSQPHDPFDRFMDRSSINGIRSEEEENVWCVRMILFQDHRDRDRVVCESDPSPGHRDRDRDEKQDHMGRACGPFQEPLVWSGPFQDQLLPLVT